MAQETRWAGGWVKSRSALVGQFTAGDDTTQVEYEAVFQDGTQYRFHLSCAGLWDAERRDAQRTRIAQEQAPATFDKARQTVKESAQTRDRADLLSREAETIREESRRVKRGEQPEE